MVGDRMIGRFHSEHSLGIWDPNEFIFSVPHREGNGKNGWDISRVKELSNHGFLPSMSLMVDKLISHNGELDEGLYSRPGLEVLNPRDPRVHPYVNRGSIAYEITSTLNDNFLGVFNRLPNRRGHIRWIFMQPIRFDFVLGSKNLHA